jgi:hypothetical protein
VEPGSFGLKILGDPLRSDAPAGMRSWAVFLEATGGVQPFEHILDAAMSERTAAFAPSVAGRCELLAGDFFEQVPPGADCYPLATSCTTGTTAGPSTSSATAADPWPGAGGY